MSSYYEKPNYIRETFFTTIPLRKRLLAFLRDLHPSVENFKIGEVANLTAIEPHAIVDLITSLGVQQVGPGVFNLKEVLNALGK
jgi:hypothetical protein